MRLIDANRYKKILDNAIEGTYGLDDPTVASVMVGAFIACSCLLDQLPAVDAAPVVHGKYSKTEMKDELYSYIYTCLECGTHCMVFDAEWNEIHIKICPNCGAKMDGERNED